jgi:hypothetical protein
MRTRTKKANFKLTIPFATLLAAGMMIFMFGAARTAPPPDIHEFMVPPSLHELTATARTVSADQDELAKINKDFGNAYRLHEVTYHYTAPDTLEYTTRVGFLTGTYTSTNTENIVSVPAMHIRKSTAFGRDITKRNTLFALGLLPQNYLDIMRVDYVGTDKAWGVDCQVYLLRYSTDPPNDKRRFEIWVDPDKHYVVQKRVWDGGDHQHETIAFLNPKEVLPGFWMPTRADAFAPDGKIAGSIEYADISAS